ncbi:Carbonic anhydrase 2 [Smittium culicis]|uniref:Carbonic anhydrase n=1 Tax=Smittium culicis TaxID=133412 RepID=A0A1R1YEL0_9FUNG|nr:Carbonic anhydrase 2 [Smittium culicis]
MYILYLAFCKIPDLGTIFTLRNIANCVCKSDINSLSVVQYAIEGLGIKEIAVVGHTNCGGIEASLDIDALDGPIKDWLLPINKLYLDNKDEMDKLSCRKEKLDNLCKLNIRRVVGIIDELDFINKARSNGDIIKIKGWIYDIGSGGLHDLGITTH